MISSKNPEQPGNALFLGACRGWGVIAGSRLASLASRAAQLPAVPGVVYDPHHYQFLARYFETPGSTSPTTKRFPLRRWGFLKSFKFACDAVLGAHKPGDFSDSEVQPVDETVAVS